MFLLKFKLNFTRCTVLFIALSIVIECKSQQSEYTYSFASLSTCIQRNLKSNVYCNTDDPNVDYRISINNDYTYEEFNFSALNMITFFNVGRWKEEGDSVKMEGIDVDSLNLVCCIDTVSNRSSLKNDTCSIHVLDNKGVGIPDFRVQPIKKGQQVFLKQYDDNEIVYDHKGQMVSNMLKSDTTGKIKVPTKDLDGIDLASLSFILGRPHRLSLNHLLNEITIVLNIDRVVFLGNHHIRYEPFHLPDTYSLTEKWLKCKDIEFYRGD